MFIKKTYTFLVILLLSFISLHAKMLTIEKDCIAIVADGNKITTNIDTVSFKTTCLKTAKYFQKERDYDKASLYYLLVGQYNYVIDEFEQYKEQNKEYLYSSLALSYMFLSDFDKSQMMLEEYFKSEKMRDNDMQDYFKILLAIYPEFKDNILKVKKIWDELYEPYNQLIVDRATYRAHVVSRKVSNQDKLIHLSKYMRKLERNSFKFEKLTHKNCRVLIDIYLDIIKIYEKQGRYKKTLPYYAKIHQSNLVSLKFTKRNQRKFYANIIKKAREADDKITHLKYYKVLLKLNGIRYENSVKNPRMQKLIKENKDSKDFKQLRVLFVMQDIFNQKNKEVNKIFDKQSTDEKFNLHNMDSNDFLQVVRIIYEDDKYIKNIPDLDGLNDKDFNFIYKQNIKHLESNFDDLFYIMSKYNLNKAVAYIKYIEKYNDYDKTRFIQQNFKIDNYLKYYGNKDINNYVAKISKILLYADKIKYIDSLTMSELIGIPSKELTPRDIEHRHYLVDILKTRLLYELNPK